LLILVGLGRAIPAQEAPPLLWIGPEDQEVRFSSLEDLRRFLQTADILRDEALDIGVTGARRLLLEQGGRRLRAHFQSFDADLEPVEREPGRIELYLRDSYRFNIAAYHLSVVLGLDNVPPSFPRRIRGQRGAVTVWLENSRPETERAAEDQRPPDPLRWSRQLIRMRVFDQLIANTDRNQGNILIDPEWKIWLIDHTRAFLPRPELGRPQFVRACDRQLWIKLLQLSDDEIRAAVERWLSNKQIKALLKRRRLLVEHIQQLIGLHGEEAVLFDLGPGAGRPSEPSAESHTGRSTIRLANREG
jgi:hypothetical protein